MGGRGVRLVATDLDGTALPSELPNPQPSPRLIAAVAAVRRVGIHVVVVTGRSRRSAVAIARRLGADRLICSNGALVWDLDRDCVDRHWSFSHSVAHDIAAQLRDRAPEVAFAWESHEAYGWEEAFDERWGGPRRDWHPQPSAAVEDGCTAPIIKLIASLHGDDWERARIYDELVGDLPAILGDEALFTSAGGSWIEIGPPGITKGVTLAAVAAEFEISAPEVIAFGDAMNDIPMLEWAGRGVAMANADPDVLSIADEVTLSNDEDGVAVILESLAS